MFNWNKCLFSIPRWFARLLVQNDCVFERTNNFVLQERCFSPAPRGKAELKLLLNPCECTSAERCFWGHWQFTPRAFSTRRSLCEPSLFSPPGQVGLGMLLRRARGPPSTASPAASVPLSGAASWRLRSLSCEMKRIYCFASQGHREGGWIVWQLGSAGRLGYDPANPSASCCAQSSRSAASLRSRCRLFVPADLSLLARQLWIQVLA